MGLGPKIDEEWQGLDRQISAKRAVPLSFLHLARRTQGNFVMLEPLHVIIHSL